MSAILTRRRVGLREKGTDSLVLIAVPFALWALDVIKICITQKHSNMSAMGAGRPLVGLMRSMSVPGPLLYTSPSVPIYPPLTLTLLFCSLLIHCSLGRFRTIPSDTVSLWISDLRLEVLMRKKSSVLPPSPVSSPVGRWCRVPTNPGRCSRRGPLER